MTESNSIRTIVVDDEPLLRQGLADLLKKQPDVEVIAECESGEEAVFSVKKNQPDLLFLDIQMPGLNGFDVLARIDKETMPFVIFVTAYDEFAIEAFRVNALDYLLKPFSDERLLESLDRAREMIQQKKDSDDKVLPFLRKLGIGNLYFEEESESTIATRIAVRSAKKITIVPTDEIRWIKATDYYVTIFAGTEKHLHRESLTSLEQRLDPKKFMRIHRSTIVRLDCIREVIPHDNNELFLKLDDGTELRVSRTFKDKLSKNLNL